MFQCERDESGGEIGRGGGKGEEKRGRVGRILGASILILRPA